MRTPQKSGEGRDAERKRLHEARETRARGEELAKLEDPLGALDAYRKAVELDPGYARAWLGLGQLLLETEHPDEGLSACKTAVELKPLWPMAHIVLALAHRDRNDADAAIESARNAIALQPGSLPHRERILATLQNVGLAEEAVTLCEEETAAAPEDLDALARLAGAYFAADRGEEAVAIFKRLVEQDPADGASRMSLLQVLYTMGDLEGCLAQGREALHAQGLDPGTRNAIERFVRRVFLEVTR